MKSPFFFLAICCLLILGNVANAQEYATKDASSFFKTSVGVHAGTQGLGLQAQTPILSFLNLRAGASFMPFRGAVTTDIGSRASKVNMSTSFLNAHLLTDWHLFPQSESVLNKFIFTAGAGYFFKAKGKAEAQMKEGYSYGDIYFESGELGKVIAQADWEGVAPYAGLGVNNIRIDNRVNFGLGLGTYYLTSPSVSVVGTKMLSDNSSNEEVLQRNLKDYRFLPVLQFNFNYTLNFKK